MIIVQSGFCVRETLSQAASLLNTKSIQTFSLKIQNQGVAALLLAVFASQAVCNHKSDLIM
jgi:hypothetical protein